MEHVNSGASGNGYRDVFKALAMLMLLAFAASAMPLAAAHAQSQSSVTVSSVDQNGNLITGYYVVLYDSNGNVVTTGFTTANFTTDAGSTYGLQADSYGNCTFSSWSGVGSQNPMSFTATSGAQSFTAQYNCTDSGSGGGSGGGSGSSGGGWTSPGESGNGAGTITIYDHRVPQSDWASCFATNCTNPQASCDTACTGPGASMWVVLYDSSGNVVATGFSDESGLVFSGLSTSATYYLYPSDCDNCHGSTHDVLFDQWATGSTTRPLEVVANGSYYDAWYTCTNGCGGG
jgi:hypothetical protein